MVPKELMLIGKKEALSILPVIITRNDLCYYLTDDYLHFFKLNKNLPDDCEILNLAGVFQEALKNLRRPFLNLFAELSNKYNSLAWWETHLASRNSASIPLLRNIIYLYSAIKILDGSSSRRTIFIGESQALLDSIAKVALERGYHVVHHWRKVKIIHYCRLWLAYGKRIINFSWQNFKSRRAAFSILKPMSKKRSDRRKRAVIRTWITKDTFTRTGEFKDRNFGVLPTWLREQGYEIWTLPMFFNLPGSLKDMYLLMKNQGDPYLIPDHYLKLNDYLQALYIGFKQLIIPLKNIRLESMDVTLLFREIQLDQGFSPDLLTFNLCYPLLKRLKKLGVKIDKFYYPFENNVPEKPFILGVHRYFPESESVAFQHTVFFPDQLAMFLSQEEVKTHPIADRIICSGPIYLNILKDAGFPYQILKSGPNLRFTLVHNRGVPKDEDTGKQRILLLPLSFDKNLSYELIFKVKVALENMPDYLVCIRTHPLLLKGELREFLSEIEMTDFQFADEGTMQDWLPKSYAVILTGGSVTTLESAVMGIPVIRVIPDNTFHYDPLAWSPYPIKPVNKAIEIRNNLNLISEMLKEDKNIFHEIGNQVLLDYFTPVDENNLKVFL